MQAASEYCQKPLTPSLSPSTLRSAATEDRSDGERVAFRPGEENACAHFSLVMV
jgi:hypothetical protein